MASALKTLFQDIAYAIREKTGNTDTMKPIDFPEEILSIVISSGDGGESGSEGTSSGSALKCTTGSFNPENYSTGYVTIEHGLDTMPDFVMVYLSFSSGIDTSLYPLQLSYGFNTAIGKSLGLTTLRGVFYHNFYNSTQSTGMDSTTSSSGFVNCNNDSTFTIKNSTNDNGKLAEATYHWIAISGMGGGVASSELQAVIETQY